MVAKNVKEALKILLSYPIYSQIWLNFFFDDLHVSYITKMGEKKKKKQWVWTFVILPSVPKKEH
jgi:hypothetical protein